MIHRMGLGQGLCLRKAASGSSQSDAGTVALNNEARFVANDPFGG